ncbi:MAG TPA: alpha-D-ribose 1-methylphosphonate 5-triphosphate diphosphatase [Paracoccaceae bacterium]|nr:alpha-D-ribose 1-methylphosphonate 5-triphosphate diphosphatase [Paracoccaceae bacterium]
MLIRGGRALVEGSLEPADLRLEDGLVAEIGAPQRDGALTLDAAGLLVLPAFIDIHGDAFERQVMPRDGVFVPTEVAVLETDRQLAANGIATAYHALTLSWEPGLRSVERGEAFIDAIAALDGRLTVENRVQLRWETFAFEALPLMRRALAAPTTPSIAFNDHTSMHMRRFGMALQERPLRLGPDEVAALDDPRMRLRSEGNARRAGLPVDEYVALLGRIWAREPQVEAVVQEVAAAARAARAPLLSHDDSQPQMRDYFAALGADIAEFPMAEHTARAARARGDWVVLGAPNAARGGSHLGSPAAADLLEDGTCNILASDYYDPAMLAAVARLHAERRAPFAALWDLVARNPALASGLPDRGEIAEGRRADLVLVEWPEGGVPAVKATLSAGRIAYLGADLLR